MPEHVCPWWVGYLLASPIRKLFQDPHQLLAPYITEDMTVVEPGPGMGFFTLELARLVGAHGRVIAIDVQPKMLRSLAQRARKVNLEDRIELREPKGDSMNIDDLTGKVDVVLAAAVVHELPNPALFFQEMSRALKPQGRLLLVEPAGHIKLPAWEATLQQAYAAGLHKHQDLIIKRAHAAILINP
jgi:ubiquinone/menaquinone biosynthesis C-methylase UbiE